MNSLDPRVARLGLPENEVSISENEQWPTFEVFHQAKTGNAFVHVGSVHAPDAEMALVLAKEQFSRRGLTNNIWVAKTTDIYSLNNGSDMFATTPDKKYREPIDYKVRDKIQAFNAKNKD